MKTMLGKENEIVRKILDLEKVKGILNEDIGSKSQEKQDVLMCGFLKAVAESLVMVVGDEEKYFSKTRFNEDFFKETITFREVLAFFRELESSLSRKNKHDFARVIKKEIIFLIQDKIKGEAEEIARFFILNEEEEYKELKKNIEIIIASFIKEQTVNSFFDKSFNISPKYIANAFGSLVKKEKEQSSSKTSKKKDLISFFLLEKGFFSVITDAMFKDYLDEINEVITDAIKQNEELEHNESKKKLMVVKVFRKICNKASELADMMKIRFLAKAFIRKALEEKIINKKFPEKKLSPRKKGSKKETDIISDESLINFIDRTAEAFQKLALFIQKEFESVDSLNEIVKNIFKAIQQGNLLNYLKDENVIKSLLVCGDLNISKIFTSLSDNDIDDKIKNLSKSVDGKFFNSFINGIGIKVEIHNYFHFHNCKFVGTSYHAAFDLPTIPFDINEINATENIEKQKVLEINEKKEDEEENKEFLENIKDMQLQTLNLNKLS